MFTQLSHFKKNTRENLLIRVIRYIDKLIYISDFAFIRVGLRKRARDTQHRPHEKSTHSTREMHFFAYYTKHIWSSRWRRSSEVEWMRRSRRSCKTSTRKRERRLGKLVYSSQHLLAWLCILVFIFYLFFCPIDPSTLSSCTNSSSHLYFFRYLNLCYKRNTISH